MRKRKAIFEECIKNYLYEAESVLKIQLKISKVRKCGSGSRMQGQKTFTYPVQ
jgi:hypothetical protein